MDQLLATELESILNNLQDDEVRDIQHALKVKFEYDWYDNKYRIRQKDLNKILKKKQLILQHVDISNNIKAEMFIPEVQYVL
ncbi:hypothetical protein V6O07_03200 [Arthrospira platensis SPKY2]